MAGKKKRQARGASTPESRAAALAKVDELIAGGTPTAQAVEAVAKKSGVSSAGVYGWRRAAKPGSEPNGAPPKLDGLDLILDIIELCERAKKGLTKSQRARLKAALNERLS
jgi:hypothetical protein